MVGSKIRGGVLAGIVGLFGISWAVSADPPRVPADRSSANEKIDPAKKPDTIERVSVPEAKERAKLMHKIYASTLETLHHHYFRSDRAVLPARAMEDVFDDIDEQSKIKTRWIAVNTQAMSIKHEPQTDFEKKAATELASGKAEYTRIEKGYFYRATPIPLGPSCVGCHTRFFSAPSKTPRFAGLVISIPVKNK